MARVELPEGIEAIHGRVGGFIFRSRKQPDGTYKVFASMAPVREMKKVKNAPKRGGKNLVKSS